jgi:hypothetical protein
MIYGRFEAVDELGQRRTLDAFMDHLAPGRRLEVRGGNDKEHAATTVLRISLAEAACKVRSGGPNDDEEDMGIAAWVGELPFLQLRTAPVADPACTVAAPDYVRDWASEP